MTIMALGLGLVLPVFSALSANSEMRATAGKLANLINRRIAMARSGGGPTEVALSGDSKVIAVIPEEISASSAGSGADSVLGHDILSASPTNARTTDLSEDNAAEILDLGGIKVEGLYVKTAGTGEDKDTLSVSAGACDDGLFVLSSGNGKTYVSVRGLAGRARVYDTMPAFLTVYFEVGQNGTTLGK